MFPLAPVSTDTAERDPCTTVPLMVRLLFLVREETGFRISDGATALTLQVAVVAFAIDCRLPPTSLPSTATVCVPSARPVRVIVGVVAIGLSALNAPPSRLY